MVSSLRHYAPCRRIVPQGARQRFYGAYFRKRLPICAPRMMNAAPRISWTRVEPHLYRHHSAACRRHFAMIVYVGRWFRHLMSFSQCRRRHLSDAKNGRRRFSAAEPPARAARPISRLRRCSSVTAYRQPSTRFRAAERLNFCRTFARLLSLEIGFTR